jgi:hypothetical protein
VRENSATVIACRDDHCPLGRGGRPTPKDCLIAAYPGGRRHRTCAQGCRNSSRRCRTSRRGRQERQRQPCEANQDNHCDSEGYYPSAGWPPTPTGITLPFHLGNTSAEWAVVIRPMLCKAPPVLGSGLDVAGNVPHDPGPRVSNLIGSSRMSERLSRTARWYSTGQIASRNPPPAPDARRPRCCLPGGARTR